MSYESPEQKIGSPETTLDDRWYNRFKEVGAFEDYEFLGGDKKKREEQQRKFLTGETENPKLDYPKLETFDFNGRESALLQLKKDVLAEEPNDIVKQLYRWRINEKLAELRMLRAVKNGDGHRFFRYSKFIYGTPEKNIHTYSLSQLQIAMKSFAFEEEEDIDKREAAKRVGSALSLFTTTFDHQLDSPQFAGPEITSAEQEYSAEDIKIAFESALERYQISDFLVVVDQKATGEAISVSQEKKTIFIPANRKMKTQRLQALIEHEIGTHVRRRNNGERSKLKLLGLGLDRYNKGEEGVATLQEQKIEGARGFSGLDGHLAISLATGVDGVKRNFREVFSILKDYYLTQSEKTGAEALREAENKAYLRCVRAFRGTDCATPGICHTRDIVYREGNIGAWDVITKNPAETLRFMIGKYDPANLRHIWILDQLGISENDLVSLEEDSDQV